jgi:hypothetical protein
MQQNRQIIIGSKPIGTWPILCWILLLLPAINTYAEELADNSASITNYQYRTPGSTGDHRFSYEMELLRLALDKTTPEFGPYTLTPAAPMNLPRAMALATGKDNLIFKTSYAQKLTNTFYYPAYPIDRGIFSYRICFENNQSATQTGNIVNLEQLRKLSIGQGVGWLDSDILKHNGFSVMEAANYENLFPMLAGERFDLFCRGPSEIQPEWQNYGDIGGFRINPNLALYYPLPRFFWVHKSKPKVFARLNRGLQLAYTDGSALELWRKHYQANLGAINLNNRRIFILRNPYLNNINPQYKKYFLGREELSSY